MRLSRRWRSERGTAMVEFAVVLPIFLFVIWCIVDFARAFYTQNSLASAVREGARYAAVTGSPGSSATLTGVRTRVAQSFNAFGGSPIPSASITVVNDSAIGKVSVKVTNYQWQTTTPINIFTGGQVLMTKTATFRWEREDT